MAGDLGRCIWLRMCMHSGSSYNHHFPDGDLYPDDHFRHEPNFCVPDPPFYTILILVLVSVLFFLIFWASSE